jgi:hypothetical protein
VEGNMRMRGIHNNGGPNKGFGRIRIIYRRISELRYWDDDPALLFQDRIISIAARIEVFELKVPILINKDLLVISGDEYVLAYRFLGYEKVPTVYLDELNEAEGRPSRSPRTK